MIPFIDLAAQQMRIRKKYQHQGKPLREGTGIHEIGRLRKRRRSRGHR